MTDLKLMLIGAIALACYIISLSFVRFWRTTHDRFFLFFAASFFIEGLERTMNGLIKYSHEQEPLFYTMRLVAFLLLIYAIIYKNRLGDRKTD